MGRVHVLQTQSKIDRESTAEATFRLSLFLSWHPSWSRERGSACSGCDEATLARFRSFFES